MSKINTDRIGTRDGTLDIDVKSIMVRSDAMENLGDYEQGIELAHAHEFIVKGDSWYTAKTGQVPYVLTGVWEYDKERLEIYGAWDHSSLKNRDKEGSHSAGAIAYDHGSDFPDKSLGKELQTLKNNSSDYQIVDSFEQGATITERNQALQVEADGRLYRWAGDLPKTVAAGSSPETTGGAQVGAWLEVSDLTLRQDLANPDKGAAMMAYGVGTVADKLGEIISVDDYGALGDGVTDDSATINEAITHLSGIYMATGRPQTLRFTDGKRYLCRLVMVRPGVNLVGGGGAVLLKTPAGDVTSEGTLKWWRLFDTHGASFSSEAACAHRILIEGLIFDGNLDQMNWTNNTYNQEHGHCLFLSGSSTPASVETRAKFHVRNVHFQNSVADGLSFYRNADLIAESITAENCFRGGFVATGGNSSLVLRGYIGENARLDIEVDGAGFDGSYRLDCDIDGVIIDREGGGIRPGGIDFGVRLGGMFRMRNAHVFTPGMIFAGSMYGDRDLLIESCYFTLGELSPTGNRFVSPSGVFKNCTFFVKEVPDATSYSAVHIYPFQMEGGILELDRCKFVLDPNIKLNNPDAVCDVFRSTGSYTSVTEPPLYRLINCETVGDWDHYVHIIQGGFVEVSGGSITASTLFRMYASLDRPSGLTVTGRIFTSSRTTRMFGGVPQLAYDGNYIKLISLELDKALQVGSTMDTYPIVGGYTFPVESAPVSLGAFAGAVARLNSSAANGAAVQEWVATTTHASNSTWRASRHVVLRGPTASRPALTSSDVGVAYQDTSIGGKQVIWTGSGWTDSSGTPA